MIGAFEDRPVPLVAHIDGKLPAPSLADFGEVIDQFTRLHGRPREPLVPAGWTAPAGLGDCLDALAWALVEPLETGENRKEAVQLMMRGALRLTPRVPSAGPMLCGGTAVAGPILAMLTDLTWLCVGIRRRAVLPCPARA